MKWLIEWTMDGHYFYADVVDAKDKDAAMDDAYEAWRDQAESQADYRARPLTKKLAEEHGFLSELDDA